ncbi:hypothetical protein [Agrobacterium tumefaciens]|uniref:Apea-like HEPN domain-containing protein n=1 Tax=Agrobacterium tumefaciens TaxID=358 RepID=A0A2L2LMK7_AGRTU|nr:hypothetical protein [Agrobacterium tumefaciens]AVH45555.1 hypothetical protein At1D1609_55240 [Agrobacterium tumefaciens]NSY99351.1 hypothetical protein [Agrobacterium tumefaciens]
MTVPAQLVIAVENLWRMPPPGTVSLTKMPAFIKLTEVCGEIYGFPHADSALSNALRSLGAPYNLRRDCRDSALNPELAALKLHEALINQTVRRRHLCPLDLCDDLPSIRFGNSVVGEFTEPELAEFLDVARLARFYPTYKPPVRQLTQFRWLVVEEYVAVDPRPEARALPILFVDLSQDFGEIDPHLGRFPPAVEAAIFFLLLAPWEDWAVYPEANWRAFRIPWLHTVDDDLFVRPMAPPSPDTLSLQPDIAYDRYGDEVEIERPTVNNLEDEARTDFTRMNESLWQNVLAARAGVLFETPIVHFIVRAFLADGMDEIMAHMTAIEAGLGLEMDHRRGLRPKPDAHRNVSPSDRAAARLAALLNDANAATAYRELFELRSSYVHGRAGLAKIPTPLRLNARRLARKMAESLVAQPPMQPATRVQVLSNLLDRGAPLL